MGSSRLYTKGRLLGHKRGKRNSRPNTALVELEGVGNAKDTAAYLGKRVAYAYRVKGGEIRVIWGRISRPHGNAGVVKAKFSSAIPAILFGASVRVMLYPSSI